MTANPLRVLVVADDTQIVQTLQRIVVQEGDRMDTRTTVEACVEVAKSTPFDVAFVDLTMENSAALALCHHLPVLCPSIAVHAFARPRDLELGGQALSLGATSVIVWPPTGDAIVRVLGDAKSSVVRRREVGALEETLTRERKRLETYDRLVRFARGAAQSEAIKAIVDGVSQLSEASGVALYASFGDDDSDRLRLAAIGSALDLPAASKPADLSRLAQARQARVVPLVASTGELGILVLDHAPKTPESDVTNLANLAGAMLSLVDRHDNVDETVKIFAPRHFRGVVDRMLSLSARHDRRASVLAIGLGTAERQSQRDEVAARVAEIVRNTDALCGAEDGDLLVFLPETNGLGAQACRRRILARLGGERRGRPKAPTSGLQEPPNKTTGITVGIASFPHDGAGFKRLVKVARVRAVEESRSTVHALSLDGKRLPEIVDALIARPIWDAGPRSPSPVDIACSALFGLVTHACREAMRGGEVNVVATLRPGLGVASAARQQTSPRVFDFTRESGCENIEAIVVEAEHASWVCCGRVIGDRFRGIHASDPLLGDILTQRLAAVGAIHAG